MIDGDFPLAFASGLGQPVTGFMLFGRFMVFGTDDGMVTQTGYIVTQPGSSAPTEVLPFNGPNDPFCLGLRMESR
jgi:hypothetical protein